MELKNLFDRIDNEMRNGDIKDACNLAGVSTQVYTNLRKRNSFQKVTAKEQSVLEGLIGILNKRKEEFGSLLNDHAIN